MNKKIKSSAVEILDFFLGIPEALAKGFDRKEFYSMMRGMSSEQVLTTSNICKVFHRFKKSGYIEIREDSDKNESIKFTNKAKLLVIDKLASMQKIDNKFTLVSFDIPERLRANRDQFRRTIKRMGFRQIQKSLWVSNRNIGQLVELAANEYNINDYLVYIVSERTNIDNYIFNLFNPKEQSK